MVGGESEAWKSVGERRAERDRQELVSSLAGVVLEGDCMLTSAEDVGRGAGALRGGGWWSRGDELELIKLSRAAKSEGHLERAPLGSENSRSLLLRMLER